VCRNQTLLSLEVRAEIDLANAVSASLNMLISELEGFHWTEGFQAEQPPSPAKEFEQSGLLIP
jgi:hypothetical protein